MSSDTPPPPNSSPHHVNPGSSTLAGTAESGTAIPTPHVLSRPGSAGPSAMQGIATENELLQSQPMTTASSTEAANTDQGSSSATPTAYGTRSRGRNANARPNYAEDRDFDMDLEVSNAPPKTNKRNSGPALDVASGANSEGEKTTSRKTQSAVNGANAAAKDSIPGTSTFSTKAENGQRPSGTTRKRKQPSTLNANGSNGSAAKRIFTTAPESVQEQQPSMVTFETHGPYLKDGKLTADDGSAFAANGWSPKIHVSLHMLGHMPWSPFDISWLTFTRQCLSHLRTSRRAILSGAHHGVHPFQQRVGLCSH